nr:hypothetical protein [Tanacetum cinerariifolium]
VLALNVDNVFQAEDCDAFDSDVDEAQLILLPMKPDHRMIQIFCLREQVELYEQRAKFELTEREQKINEQLRLVISNRNFKEETLKRELHSTKLQLTSTINRNKSMVEETTFLNQDFKQKENKLLADFLNMKSLKEKVDVSLEKSNKNVNGLRKLTSCQSMSVMYL